VLFDSPVYFLFLTIVVFVYWRLTWRKQNWMLLAASYFFYGWWDWRFLGLMMLSTTLDYFIAFRIAGADDPRRRKAFLILSLVLNFTFLGFFKYFNFFVDSLLAAAATMGVHHLSAPLLRVLLPPGISFYTFQEVAYIVDVYRRKEEPAHNFVDYALFVSLFPHLIAGPIQRPRHLLNQVQHARSFDTAVFFDGVMLIVFGLFRKCVLADNFGIVANLAFDGSLGRGFYPTMIGATAFAFQIYGDFSGYTDLARGSAKLLGFQFVVNFRRPYLAVTLQHFWRRWHVSLSSWLRDYLYIPLGGNQKGSARTYLNLMITMLLGGLWHGANWTFVVWGGLHGCWLAAERFFAEDLKTPIDTKLGTAASRFITLTVVGIAWIFFRSTTLKQAINMVGDLVDFTWNADFGPVLIFIAVLGGIVVTMDLLLEQEDDEYLFQRQPISGPILAAGLLLVTALFGALNSNAFIYFQF
jgi:alginate O-acetyltransferase complex protein AlgI